MGVSKDTLNPSVTNPFFPTAKETNVIQQMEASKGSWPRGVLTQVHFHSTNFFPPLLQFGLRNVTASYLRKGSGVTYWTVFLWEITVVFIDVGHS